MEGLRISSHAGQDDGTNASEANGTEAIPSEIFVSSSSCVLQDPWSQLVRLGGGYSSFGISPSTMKNRFDVAVEKIKKDKILDHHFAVTPDQLRCLVFLYGRDFCGRMERFILGRRDYCSKMRREARIAEMRALIDEPEAFDRLCRIAFSELSFEKMLTDQTHFDRYANMHITVHFLTTTVKKGFGGFQGDAIYRIQESENCYTTPVCAWVALKQRFDGVGGREVLDTAQVAQKLIDTDEKLNKRVLDNKGENTTTYACKLTQTDPSDWYSLNLPATLRFLTMSLHDEMVRCYHSCGPGLVTFVTPKRFQTINMSDPMAASTGAWYFPTDEADCTPKFLACDFSNNEFVSTEKERLKILFDDEKEKRENQEKELNERLEKAFARFKDGEGPTVPTDVEDSDNGEPVRQSSGSRHAVVFIGGFTLQSEDGSKREVLMFLNWYRKSPLIFASAEWLKNCSGMSHFLTKPLTENTGSLIDRHSGFGAETAADVGDNVDELSIFDTEEE